VLRLHIFDIEPPSVVGTATEVIVRQIKRGNIKNCLENAYVFPTQTLMLNCSNLSSRSEEYKQAQDYARSPDEIAYSDSRPF